MVGQRALTESASTSEAFSFASGGRIARSLTDEFFNLGAASIMSKPATNTDDKKSISNAADGRSGTPILVVPTRTTSGKEQSTVTHNPLNHANSRQILSNRVTSDELPAVQNDDSTVQHVEGDPIEINVATGLASGDGSAPATDSVHPINGSSDRDSPEKNADAFAMALATGGTIATAARTAGISVSTAYRRWKDPTVRRRVKELRAQMKSNTMGALTDGMTAAARTLHRLLGEAPPHIQLAAAQVLLKHGNAMTLERSDPLYDESEISFLSRMAKHEEEFDAEKSA